MKNCFFITTCFFFVSYLLILLSTFFLHFFVRYVQTKLCCLYGPMIKQKQLHCSYNGNFIIQLTKLGRNLIFKVKQMQHHQAIRKNWLCCEERARKSILCLSQQTKKRKDENILVNSLTTKLCGHFDVFWTRMSSTFGLLREKKEYHFLTPHNRDKIARGFSIISRRNLKRHIKKKAK